MDISIDIPIYKSLPQKVLNDTELTFLSPIDVQQLYVNEPFTDSKNNKYSIIYQVLALIIILIILFFI
jgi:hypothetical protein